MFSWLTTLQNTTYSPGVASNSTRSDLNPEGPELFVFERAGGGLFAEPRRYGPNDEVDLDLGCARVGFRPAQLLE